MTETAHLHASDPGYGDNFGYSVAIDGDTAVIGAKGDDGNIGSAYVFVRSGGIWTQQAKLTASDGAANDYFGWAVAVSGDTAIVGAYQDDDLGNNCGSAYVFVKPGGGWANMTETTKLVPSSLIAMNAFGYAVAIDGDVVVVGSTGDRDGGSDIYGAAYVFVKPGGGWPTGTLSSYTAKLLISDRANGDGLGKSVSINGDNIVAGANGDDGLLGSAYLFTEPGGGWSGTLTETTKMVALVRTANGGFGIAVGIDGELIVIGDRLESTVASYSGAAYSYALGGGCTGDGDCDDPTPYCETGSGLCVECLNAGHCDDSNVCTDDSCDGSYTCQHANNTAACDDTLFCNGTDTCSGGSCSQHTGDPCVGGGECNESCDEDNDDCYDAAGTACTDDGNECTEDQCDGAGACGHPNKSNGTGCTDDGNPCTDDECQSGTCTHPNDDTNTCSDGIACTEGDACSSGTCVGTPNDAACDDTNICTDDTCNPATGCEYVNNTDPCDDGLWCTVGDACSGGSCSGSARDCGDGVACTDDSCDEDNDECDHVANDGNCDDSNVCTDDTCNPTTGCEYTNNTDPCDDGQWCTVGDACSGGSCSGSARDCDDSLTCTSDSCNEGTDSCDNTLNADTCLIGGTCYSAGDRNPSDSCQECNDDLDPNDWSVLPNGTSCDDGVDCTEGETCTSGACGGGTPNSSLCDDGNTCTADTCHATLGCQHTCSGAPCYPDWWNTPTWSATGSFVNETGNILVWLDHSPAPSSQVVAAAKVTYTREGWPGAPLDPWVGTTFRTPQADGQTFQAPPYETYDYDCTQVVDDGGNPIRTWTRLIYIAYHDDPEWEGALLDFDSDPSGNGFWSGNWDFRAFDLGACAGCLIGGTCYNDGEDNPGNDCQWCDIGESTTAWTDKMSGAACGDPSDTECDNPDTCDGSGNCQDNYETSGTACTDDGNECTNDECDGAGACTHPNKSDGTACTDDGNVCTDDECQSGTCAHPNNTASCDDGVFCNGMDTCSGGSCSDHAGDPCVGGGECNESCDEVDDDCYDDAGTACTDDGNECTDDECDGAGTCTHPNKSDGTACTDDGNGCTDDECQSGTCAHPNNTDPCDDGLYCNGTDTCSGGSCSDHAGDPCVGGGECNESCNETTDDCFDASGTSCTDDGNVCTDDECNGAGTCTHPNNTASCNDGLFCNGADTCSGGSCSDHAGDPCVGGGGVQRVLQRDNRRLFRCVRHGLHR